MKLKTPTYGLADKVYTLNSLWFSLKAQIVIQFLILSVLSFESIKMLKGSGFMIDTDIVFLICKISLRCSIVVHSKTYLFHCPSKILKSCRSSSSQQFIIQQSTSGPPFHWVWVSFNDMNDLYDCVCEFQKHCIKKSTIRREENVDMQQYLRDSTNTNLKSVFKDETWKK